MMDETTETPGGEPAGDDMGTTNPETPAGDEGSSDDNGGMAQ